MSHSPQRAPARGTFPLLRDTKQPKALATAVLRAKRLKEKELLFLFRAAFISVHLKLRHRTVPSSLRGHQKASVGTLFSSSCLFKLRNISVVTRTLNTSYQQSEVYLWGQVHMASSCTVWTPSPHLAL